MKKIILICLFFLMVGCLDFSSSVEETEEKAKQEEAKEEIKEEEEIEEEKINQELGSDGTLTCRMVKTEPGYFSFHTQIRLFYEDNRLQRFNYVTRLRSLQDEHSDEEITKYFYNELQKSVNTMNMVFGFRFLNAEIDLVERDGNYFLVADDDYYLDWEKLTNQFPEIDFCELKDFYCENGQIIDLMHIPRYAKQYYAQQGGTCEADFE